MGYQLFLFFQSLNQTDQCLHKARGRSKFHGYLKTSQHWQYAGHVLTITRPIFFTRRWCNLAAFQIKQLHHASYNSKKRKTTAYWISNLSSCCSIAAVWETITVWPLQTSLTQCSHGPSRDDFCPNKTQMWAALEPYLVTVYQGFEEQHILEGACQQSIDLRKDTG